MKKKPSSGQLNFDLSSPEIYTYIFGIKNYLWMDELPFDGLFTSIINFTHIQQTEV